MANVLTAAATVDCGHGGPVTPKGDPMVKLTVDKAAVLTEAALLNQPVNSATCTTVPASAPAPVSVKCSQCTKISSPQSAKLTVNGAALLLAPLAGETNGTVANVTPQAFLKA